MYYVYILRSVSKPGHYYTGYTKDLKKRLLKHNQGGVVSTSKYKPWEIKTYIAFSDKQQAIGFEKYLKKPSGRAFTKKRL